MKILYLLIATLKFLGVAILILVLLLLLLVIIVLTVPIKYKVYINKSEQTNVDATLKWLYSIINVDIIYNSNGETIRKIKIFGRAIGPRKPKKVRKSKKINLRKKSDDTYLNVVQAHKEQVKQKKNPEGPPKKKNKKQKQTKKEKKDFKDTMRQVQSFTYKKELLTDTFVLIKRLLKDILPSRLYMEVEIGKEDPADTGQLIAKVSAFYPIYYSFASFVGNYEKECFYVKLDASGHIILGKLVYEIIRYIRKTSVKQFIKFIRKDRKGKNHGRKTAK